MQGTVSVVHEISDSILEDKEEGDPSTDIEFPELTLMIGKEEESSLSNTSYQTKQGKITLPDVDRLFNKTGREEDTDEFGKKIPLCRTRKVSRLSLKLIQPLLIVFNLYLL